MKRILLAGAYFMPPISLGIQAHSVHEWIATLLTFVLSFTAAQIIFHPDDPLTKKILEWF